MKTTSLITNIAQNRTLDERWLAVKRTREERRELIANGLCGICGKPREPKQKQSTMCAVCHWKMKVKKERRKELEKHFERLKDVV
jgi:hypothetical protein